ncbi:MAG: MBL fold metallo-hydrolase [Candidatus Omnitrophica bacterium]|nr:MBL fold metallo-hydrolase [Candidatus Omnitrophota bacterium]
MLTQTSGVSIIKLMDPQLYLKQMEIGPMQNFVYLVGDTATHEALMVDPAWDVDSILAVAQQEGYRVKGALITHTHFDHVNGLEQLLEKTDGTVYIHRNEAEFLKGMKGNIQKMEGGDKVKIGGIEINFLHTPGHTPGSQCFLVDRNLISGDTLFINACGRCDLPGGNAEQMYESLNRLANLDESIMLYPGHHYADEPTSTIANEKKFNPYLQTTNLNDFLKYRMGY